LIPINLSISPNDLKCLVVIPCYNAANTVDRAAISVRNYYPNWDIVVIDDFSTDQTKTKLKKLKRDGIVDGAIFHNHRMGVSAARNSGLSWGETTDREFIIFLDADDHLLAIDQNIELNPTDDLIFFESVEVSNTYTDFREYKNHLIKINRIRQERIGDLLEGFCLQPNKSFLFNTSWAKLFRADLIYKYQLKFNEKMHTFEDIDFNFKFMRFAREMRFIKEQLYVHAHPKVKGKTATYGNDFPVANLFSFIWSVRSMRRYVKQRLNCRELNYKHLIACYFSISSIRAASRICSFRTFVECFLFFKKRIRKKLIQACFDAYDFRKAGGRAALVMLIRFEMSFLFTVYVFCISLAAKIRQSRYG